MAAATDGKAVARVRPIEKRGERVAARLDDLSDRGVVVRPAQLRELARTVARRPGALKRFLAERD